MGRKLIWSNQVVCTSEINGVPEGKCLISRVPAQSSEGMQVDIIKHCFGHIDFPEVPSGVWNVPADLTGRVKWVGGSYCECFQHARLLCGQKLFSKPPAPFHRDIVWSRYLRQNSVLSEHTFRDVGKGGRRGGGATRKWSWNASKLFK